MNQSVGSQVLDIGAILVFLLVLHFRGPQCEVVADELHDGRGVLVLVLLDVLDVCDRVVERLLCQVAGLSGVVQHLVVEHAEVQSQT